MHENIELLLPTLFSSFFMATYKDSGVDISKGDRASQSAYHYAKKTFSSRKGLKGTPLIQDGGFAGAIDMGEYYMLNCCDGVGTKIDIAIETQNFTGLGFDLLAMTVDDAICSGSEVISITNTFDTNSVNPDEIEEMMKSLCNACIQEKVVIPGGEIAELGNTLNKTIWNSSAVGIVEKEKFITGENIEEGDHVIALQETGFRSNGFSLIRHILKEKNISFHDAYDEKNTWGEMLLTPSKIYHAGLLNILGRFDEKRKIDVKGIVHVTGGGLAGNFFRILKSKKLGASLPNIFPMPEIMNILQKLGNVTDEEAYKTWNGGNGMLIVCGKNESEELLQLLKKENISAQLAGKINTSGKIEHGNFGAFSDEKMITFI